MDLADPNAVLPAVLALLVGLVSRYFPVVGPLLQRVLDALFVRQPAPAPTPAPMPTPALPATGRPLLDLLAALAQQLVLRRVAGQALSAEEQHLLQTVTNLTAAPSAVALVPNVLGSNVTPAP